VNREFVPHRSPSAVVAGVLLAAGPSLPPPGVAVPPGEATHLLLVRRAGTRRGQWCIPCGYIDYGEEIRAAAAREMREETGLEVAVESVLSVRSNFHDPENLTVGVWFLTRYRAGELRPGDDADAAAFFPLDSPPEELAFPTDRAVIEELRQARKVPS
jgi:8-oxo-dGTP diphosphatase